MYDFDRIREKINDEKALEDLIAMATAEMKGKETPPLRVGTGVGTITFPKWIYSKYEGEIYAKMKKILDDDRVSDLRTTPMKDWTLDDYTLLKGRGLYP